MTRTSRVIYGCICAVYLLAFPWHPRLRSPNELCRLMQTRALVDFGELSLNSAMRIYGPVGDLSVRDGRYYPSKAPLLSFAAVPVYALLRAFSGGRPEAVPEIPLVFFARLFLTVLPTLLSLVLVKRLLAAYVAPAVAIAVTATYALGTLAFSYSLLFMSHQTSATLLLLGLFLGWRVARSERGRSWLALVGLLLALAVAAEYTSALAALAIGGYCMWTGGATAPQRIRSLLLLAGGGLPVVLLLGMYHQACFGGALETGYRHLADVQYQSWHQGGFLGIKTPTLRAFVGSFFSPLRGLFALSPVLLLGVWGIPLLWKGRREHPELAAVTVLTTAVTLGYAYFTSSFSYESWGWTTGPRHLTGLVPFLLLPAAVVVDSTSSGLRRGLVSGLAGASVVVTALLTLVNYVPDDVSEGLFGLVFPLAASGDLVPNALNFVGISNPAAAGLVLLALGASLAAILLLLARGRPAHYWMMSGAAVIIVLVLHRAAYVGSPADRGAVALLQRVWLAPSGSGVAFWTTSGTTSGH